MKIAIIGMGKAGRRYQEIAIEDGHEVLAYDVRGEYSSGLQPGEVLRASDAVVIASPPDSHLVWLERCGAHRKPALVEKPILDKDGFMPLGNFAIQTANIQIVPVTTYRFHPAIWETRFRYMRNPTPPKFVYIDTPENLQAETYERHPLESWIHFVDVLYWFGGAGLASQWRDLLTMDVGFERQCYAVQDGNRYDIYAERSPHVEQFRHFVQCVEGKAHPICPIEEALEILEIALS